MGLSFPLVIVSVNALCFPSATARYLPPAAITCVHWNKCERLLTTPPPSHSPYLSLFLSLPCATSSPQSTAGPPSLRPVSVLFHLACCYRGLDAGRLQLGSQSFSIYQSPPPSVPPPPTATLTTLASINPETEQFLIASPPNTPPLFPPAFHIFLFPSAQKILPTSPETKKKKYCCNGSISVREAARAVLLLRPLSLVMTQESGEYRSCVTQGIQRIALTKLVGPLIARLAALAGTQEKTLTVPYFMVAFNHSLGPESGLITVRKSFYSHNCLPVVDICRPTCL